MTPIAILSDLLSLIANSSARDLNVASKLIKDPREIAEALECLAKLKQVLERKGISTSSIRDEIKEVEKVINSSQSQPRAKDLHQLVYDESIFQSTERLARYLNKYGLAFKFRGGRGRHEIYKKLIQAVDKLSPIDRASLINVLIHNIPDEQTAGWFDVIRKG